MRYEETPDEDMIRYCFTVMEVMEGFILMIRDDALHSMHVYCLSSYQRALYAHDSSEEFDSLLNL